MPGRMHATTGLLRGYYLLSTTFGWRSLTTNPEELVKYNPRDPGDAAARNAAVLLFRVQ